MSWHSGNFSREVHVESKVAPYWDEIFLEYFMVRGRVPARLSHSRSFYCEVVIKSFGFYWHDVKLNKHMPRESAHESQGLEFSEWHLIKQLCSTCPFAELPPRAHEAKSFLSWKFLIDSRKKVSAAEQYSDKAQFLRKWIRTFDLARVDVGRQRLIR